MARYLHEGALGVADVAVELTVADTVHLGRDPADVPVQVVLLDEVEHLLELGLLLLVLGRVAVVTADHHKVDQLLQALVPAVELDQTSQVLDTIKTSHGEDDGLVPVVQHEPAQRNYSQITGNKCSATQMQLKLRRR